MAFDDDLIAPFGAKPRGVPALVVAPVFFSPGPYTFTAKVAGLYTFRLWGGGYSGARADSGRTATGGFAGGFARKAIRLSKGQQVSGQCGSPQTGGTDIAKNPSNVNNSTAVFPSGTVTASGPAYTGNAPDYYTGGSGSGGDLNLTGGSAGASNVNGTSGQGSFAGSPGVSDYYSCGGGSAPGDEYMTGGNGGSASFSRDPSCFGGFPGGGGGGNNGSQPSPGGNGLVLVTYEGP